MAAAISSTSRNGGGPASTKEPVGELRYRVEIPGLAIGEFTEVTGLQVEYEVMEYGEGGNNEFTYKIRGRRKYPNLVLKRGVTNEDGLLRWFMKYQSRRERPTVTLSLIGPDAKPVRSWAFSEAYPIKWQGPNLKAGSNGLATETLEIAHTGMVVS
jgi:phage tail-like protein